MGSVMEREGGAADPGAVWRWMASSEPVMMLERTKAKMALVPKMDAKEMAGFIQRELLPRSLLRTSVL